MALTLERLRGRYPQFRYERYSYTLRGRRLTLGFRFVVEPDIVFEPQLSLEAVDPARLDSLEPCVLSNLVFHLGLIEMLSYWKATCSPRIVVQAGYLDARQIDWWTDLLLHGMREFFYRNRINYKQPDFVRLSSTHAPPARRPVYTQALQDERDLLLLSGGKDSALSVRLLRDGQRAVQRPAVEPGPGGVRPGRFGRLPGSDYCQPGDRSQAVAAQRRRLSERPHAVFGLPGHARDGGGGGGQLP